MSIGRRMNELESEFRALGLTGFPRGLRRSKPGRMDYVLAMQDYYMDKYRAEGKATYGMEWMAKIESPQCAKSQSELTPEEFEEFINSPDTFVEEKFDGCRLVVIYSPEYGFEFFSRNRTVTDYCFANYTNQIVGYEAEAWKGFFGKKFILDCELLSINPTINGRNVKTETILQAVSALLALEKEASHQSQIEAGYPLRFKVFDILSFDGKDLFDFTQIRRKELLHKVLSAFHKKCEANGITQGAWMEEVPYVEGSGEVKKAYYKEVTGRGGEGLIIKTKSAKYKPVEARSVDRWLKWKRTVSESAEIGGADIDAFISGWERGTVGTANENLIGSVDLSVFLTPSGEEHVIARCSNLTAEVRQDMTCFDENGQMYLNPKYSKMVCTIDGQDITVRSKRFAHARILGFREDKKYFECTFSEALLASLVL